MKKLVYLIIAILFQGCAGRNPTKDNITGIWSNPDGAKFTFGKDGVFTGENLPANFLLFDPKLKDQKISGKGKWEFLKGEVNWEVQLTFHKMTSDLNNYKVPLFISEINGSWYLFIWEEEEGGKRYKFLKVP